MLVSASPKQEADFIGDTGSVKLPGDFDGEIRGWTGAGDAHKTSLLRVFPGADLCKWQVCHGEKQGGRLGYIYFFSDRVSFSCQSGLDPLGFLAS